MSEKKLTHLTQDGHVMMVDVSHKPLSLRRATARGKITMQPETLELILEDKIKKGNVIETARVAGMMAAKKTASLIPLCHPLTLSGISLELIPDLKTTAIDVEATVRVTGQTGVEMEALTAVSVACLTLYDMAKAVDRHMRIEDIRLVKKTGGQSGHYEAE